MAWWNPLSWGKEKKEQQGPPSKFLQVPRTRETVPGVPYYQSLTERLAGRNVGFEPGFLDARINPYATKARANYASYTVPTISAAASARGLGRSTIPVSQIRQGSQEVEQSIADKMAEVAYQNEIQKRSEVNDALARMGLLASEEAGQISEENTLNRAEWARQQAIRDANVDQNNVDLTKLQALISYSIDPGGYLLRGYTNSGIEGLGNNSNSLSKKVLQEYIDSYGTENAGQVKKVSPNIGYKSTYANKMGINIPIALK